MPDVRDKLQPILPQDGAQAVLVGRVWRPDCAGPSVVTLRDGAVIDVTAAFPTVRDLCETAEPARALRGATGETVGDLNALAANTPPASRDRSKPWLLAPIDLQAVKAAGVTFVTSLIERVIEERARGNPD